MLTHCRSVVVTSFPLGSSRVKHRCVLDKLRPHYGSLSYRDKLPFDAQHRDQFDQIAWQRAEPLAKQNWRSVCMLRQEAADGGLIRLCLGHAWGSDLLLT